VVSKDAGLIKLTKKLGQRVHRGDKVGTIYVPAKAKTTDLISPMCGLLFSIQYADQVSQGEIMYSILEDKKCHVKRRTVKLFEEIKGIEM